MEIWQTDLIVIGVCIIVGVGLIYLFYSQTRKLKAEAHFITELPLFYKDEIAQGKAVSIPASLPKYRKLTDMLGIGLFIIFILYVLLFQLSPIINNCLFNETFTLKLFIKQDIALLFITAYGIRPITSIWRYRCAKKTGWDGNVKGKSYEDRVVFKTTNDILTKYKKDIGFDMFLLILFLLASMNWDIIMQSSSFSEANTLAHQQCMADLDSLE